MTTHTTNSHLPILQGEVAELPRRKVRQGLNIARVLLESIVGGALFFLAMFSVLGLVLTWAGRG